MDSFSTNLQASIANYLKGETPTDENLTLGKNLTERTEFKDLSTDKKLTAEAKSVLELFELLIEADKENKNDTENI